jgi:outer membrane protein OmpA-like peptidoglycan-associated protein
MTPGVRRGLIGIAGAVALSQSSGCGLELKDRMKGIHQTIKDARDNGAYKCAPRELAMAETHAEFTDDELKYGDYVAAKEEIEIAASNAKKAFELSPKERCAPKIAILEKKVEPPLDTDKDGVLDKDDRCVTVPGPVENQGCPWPDTDKDGVLDKDDKCVDVPGPVENQGCPWPDRDKDGVLDKEDDCPDDPGPKEYKGCPDRDGDTVIDKIDKCPDVPGPPDNEGCPRYQLIVVTKEKIELKQKVHFATDKSTIYPDSFAMLNEIADLLLKRAEIEVRIEGHTDSRASMRHNMKLSQARADSVKRYLVERGVDGARMNAVGYGPTRPIDDNRTAAGREANRRVEFIITKQ